MALSIRSASELAMSTGLCLLCALAILHPALTPETLGSTLPTNSSLEATVPLLNTWTIWWNADRTREGFANYWQAPIFFPEEGAFAFSEPQPATVILAPWILLGGSPVFAYKLYLLAALTLNGVFAAMFCRRLQVPFGISLFGGIMVLYLPIIHQQIDVLQLIPVWTILWFWMALHALLSVPSVRNAVSAGLALGLSFWISIHMAVFLCILLPVPLLMTGGRSLRTWRRKFSSAEFRRHICAVILAPLTAAVMILPLVLPMRHYLGQHDFERSQKTVAGLSAKPQNYLLPPRDSLIPFPAGDPNRRHLHPGWTKLLLCLPGCLLAFRNQRSRIPASFLAVTLIVAFLLSLGTNLEIGSWNIWETIRSSVPGFSMVRNVFRFAYFVQLVIAVFACCGIYSLWILASTSSKGRISGTVLKCAAAAVGLLAVVECYPPRIHLAGVPNEQQHTGWMTFARQNLMPGKSIVCLPFADGYGVRDLDATARWMYLQMSHGLPMSNGYSGFFPASWFRLQKSLTGNSDEPAAELLFASGTDLVVVGRGADLSALRIGEDSRFVMERLYQDQGPVEVYRLSRREAF